MTVTGVRTDPDDGEVTVWVRLGANPHDSAYFSDLVLGLSDQSFGVTDPGPAGPSPGDVIFNPRVGGTMTVNAVNRDPDGSTKVWGQWFRGDEYGSGSFPLHRSGRVVDYGQDLG